MHKYIVTFLFFQNATDPLLEEIYKKLIKPDIYNLPSTYAEAANRICESKYAFVTSPIVMKKFASHSKCTIIEVPGISIPGLSAITTKKKFPFLRLMNHK